MKAFRDSGAIPEEWYENMQQAFFQRASRTDKGVSAAKMIVSLKLRECIYLTIIKSVVVAHLVERSFPIPEVRGSNPVIAKLLLRTFC